MLLGAEAIEDRRFASSHPALAYKVPGSPISMVFSALSGSFTISVALPTEASKSYRHPSATWMENLLSATINSWKEGLLAMLTSVDAAKAFTSRRLTTGENSLVPLNCTASGKTSLFFPRSLSYFHQDD
jgi:hypothetical protein